jgi:hypothetical protein
MDPLADHYLMILSNRYYEIMITEGDTEMLKKIELRMELQRQLLKKIMGTVAPKTFLIGKDDGELENYFSSIWNLDQLVNEAQQLAVSIKNVLKCNLPHLPAINSFTQDLHEILKNWIMVQKCQIIWLQYVREQIHLTIEIHFPVTGNNGNEKIIKLINEFYVLDNKLERQKEIEEIFIALFYFYVSSLELPEETHSIILKSNFFFNIALEKLFHPFYEKTSSYKLCMIRTSCSFLKRLGLKFDNLPWFDKRLSLQCKSSIIRIKTNLPTELTTKFWWKLATEKRCEVEQEFSDSLWAKLW